MGVLGRVTTFLAMDKHQEGATKIVAFQKTGSFYSKVFGRCFCWDTSLSVSGPANV